jgi:hypothetical protein
VIEAASKQKAAMAVTNCICLKFGTLYDVEYVNNLYEAVLRNTSSSLRFFCVTDDRKGLKPQIEAIDLRKEPYHDRMFELMMSNSWRAPFQKIGLHRPDLIPDLDGPLIFFDLDVLVIGDVDKIRDYAPGKLCMRRTWDQRPDSGHLGHGSVVKFEPLRHGYIWQEMVDDPDRAMTVSRGHDQIYISRTADQHGDFSPLPDSWIASFKYECRPTRPLNLLLQPRKPPDALVICFHGRPKMREAINGYRSDPLHSTRAAKWLREAWYGPGS